jgi:hypothetical protein
VARKSTINYVVSGQAADLACLENLSREELSGKAGEKPIGFAA